MFYYQYIETTQWQDWEPWSSCTYKNGELANCWKDKNDLPQSTRKRKCITKNSTNDEYEYCNSESRTCTELGVCPFGE